MNKFKFQLKAINNKSRTGFIETAHGTIQTPAFMPVGTRAAVKAMFPESVKSTGSDIILGNT